MIGRFGCLVDMQVGRYRRKIYKIPIYEQTTGMFLITSKICYSYRMAQILHNYYIVMYRYLLLENTTLSKVIIWNNSYLIQHVL